MSIIAPICVNQCQICTLPADILRQIPPSYRIWKLLQMTCTTINIRLGDYHATRGFEIVLFNDRGAVVILYDTFIKRLIINMRYRSQSLKCGMFTGGKWLSSTTSRRDLLSCDTGIIWNGMSLAIRLKDGEIQYLDYRTGVSLPYIKIGETKYIPISSKYPVELLYKYIYDEIPALYNSMIITRYMSQRDFRPY